MNNKLTEMLEKAQHDVNFLRRDLLDANKIASVENPLAGMIIAELLAQQAAMEVKLSQLIVLLNSK